ncbi:AsmA protein [Agrobacterium vitis]|nr:AsmA protein [Agrobacterium vitis]
MPPKCAKGPLGPRLLRLAVIVIVVSLGLFVASRIAAPYIVSSSLVRGSMEKVIGRWSGHKVQIGGTPELQFWPQPKITLAHLTVTRIVSDGPADNDPVLAKIDQLSATFGLLDAVMGHPTFDNFILTRPTVHLHRDRQGRIDWSNGGPLTKAIAHVTETANGGQSLAAEDDGTIGSLSIENGRLDITDDTLGRKILIDGIFAQVTWPRMSSPLKGSANMLVGGVATQMDFSSAQPLLLMGGHVGQASLSVSAPAIKGSFNGKTSLMPARFASGQINIALSDVAGFLAWTGAELPGTEALHTASVKATITAEADRLRLENLALSANETSATGLVDITQGKSGKPKVSGTLAFEHMDIPTFLAAFSLSAPDTKAVSGKSGLLNWLEFDLTLSARRASLAQFSLTDMGASVLATDGAMVFDIGDSTLAGGTMTGHLEGKNGGFEDGAHLDLSITDADLSDLENRLGLNGPLPLGPGSLTVSASTKRPIWQTRPTDITGNLKLTVGPGRMTGVNLAGIQSLAASRFFFKLQDAGKGDLPFNTLSVTAELADGAINISRGDLSGETLSSTFTGIIPYVFKGLALSTDIQPLSATGTPAADPMRLFIAGSWPDLILSPFHSNALKN